MEAVLETHFNKLCCNITNTIISSFKNDFTLRKLSEVKIPITFKSTAPLECFVGAKREIYLSYVTDNDISQPEYLLDTVFTDSSNKIPDIKMDNYLDYLVGKPDGNGGVWVKPENVGGFDTNRLANANVIIRSVLLTPCGIFEDTLKFVSPLARYGYRLVYNQARNGTYADNANPAPNAIVSFNDLTTDRDFYTHGSSNECGYDNGITINNITYAGNTIYSTLGTNDDRTWSAKELYNSLKYSLLSNTLITAPKIVILDVIQNFNFTCSSVKRISLTNLVLTFDASFGENKIMTCQFTKDNPIPIFVENRVATKNNPVLKFAINGATLTTETGLPVAYINNPNVISYIIKTPEQLNW